MSDYNEKKKNKKRLMGNPVYKFKSVLERWGSKTKR